MENTNIFTPPQSTCAISVIIPMYNVEKYIGECLDSILMQTFQDFEVIVINDCSTDNSRQVAESYLEKFGGRLTIYDNEKNSGAPASRNKGLRLSRGEYIYFMDSDDLLLLTGLEKMYTVAKKFNPDFVSLLGYYDMSVDSKEIKTISYKIKRVFKDNEEFFVDEDLIWRLRKPLDYRYYSLPYSKFCHRDFLIENEIFFPENVKRCEDVVWKYCIVLSAKKIVHVPFIVYFYRMSEDSLTRKKRTPAEYINSRMTTIIDGIKWLDSVISRVDFFEQNPQYRYLILEEFIEDLFTRLVGQSRKRKWSAFDVYDAVRQGFSEKLGKYDILVAELCSLIDSQMKDIANLKEKLNAK